MSDNSNRAIDLGRLATYDALMKDYISDELSNVVRHEDVSVDESTGDIDLNINVSEIDDGRTSTGTTWSSTKIDNLFKNIASGTNVKIYQAGKTEPINTNIFWIDTNENSGGLKYYDGDSWVHVPGL